MKNCIETIVFSMCMLCSVMALAGHSITNRTDNTTVTVGDTTAEFIVDQTDLPAAGVTADYNVQDLVTLKFDPASTHFFSTATEVSVDLTIHRWDSAGASMSDVYTTLTVNTNSFYNRQTIDKSILKLSGVYKMHVIITQVYLNGVANGSPATLPGYVYVEGEIYRDHYHNYAGTAPALSSIDTLYTDCDSLIDELEVHWGTVTGAEEYQLEWTYVNDYGYTTGTSIAQSGLIADFKNNSTRITTSGAINSYRISLTYDRGYIAFRVRGVGRDYLHPEKYIYGSWSAGDMVNMGTLGAAEVYHNLQEHEKSKNWQYSATYAEEGKKKEVISYFDGSLHNRQSVTKVNSDNNVIVGETIYDYQGRPAVNVLPTPVVFPACDTGMHTSPALKYYFQYNKDTDGNTYSKENFDKDAVEACSPGAVGMDSVSGSSLYYSGSNPNKDGFQAFVPRAEMFPFSQVEYTPDNTGRIRSQSGVGKTFQLGSGHETRYMYSQPNQVQLDRLFGSEAGDAAHYKKNSVIDANGQISISYLNQEGKTVATSLAGNAPINTDDVTYMEALPSESAAAVPFTIDAFNKDIHGNSLSNAITPLQEGIEFSTQLSVTYTGTYTFNYDLIADTLYDHCISDSGFCMSCIYDLQIKVLDECGVDLTAGSVNKRVGHLDSIPDGFTMICDSIPGTNESDTISLSLSPGVYTVSKTLTINKDARDFYLANYLDSTYNSCIRTRFDFVQEALANVDTSGCNVSCEACAAALGTKEDFVSSGRGTDLQYDMLMEECYAPCTVKSLCDNTFDMMVLDVSPGGQYGKFDRITEDASAYGLSVFNENNRLPSTTSTVTFSGHTPVPHYGSWRFPILIMNGHQYKMYLDEHGDRTKVKITKVNTTNGWSPEVNSTLGIFVDPVSGDTCIYPENLKHVSDFIPMWNDNFAKSLAIYHPEYAYYIACKDQARIMSGDTRSTEQVDSLMIVSTTFDLAITNGFIDTTTMKPFDLLTSSPTNMYDPFFTNTSGFESFYGPFASPYNTLSSPIQSQLVTQMTTRMNTYITIGATPLTMVEMAAASARCGNNFSGPTSSDCLDFGADVYLPSYPNYLHLNDSIRNAEWENFKNYYMAEKHKLEFKRMDFFARRLTNSSDAAMPSSSLLGGCNACMGNTSYNFYAAGMYIPGPTNPIYDPSQPCSYHHFIDYVNSSITKRFVDPGNNSLTASSAGYINNAGYSIYQQTGQAPVAFELNNFLTAMAQGHYLYPSSSVSLGSIPSFGPDLYTAVSGGVNPATYVNYQWNVVDTTGGILTVNFDNLVDSITACTMYLDISASGIPNFRRIISFQNLRESLLGSPGVYSFDVWATYLVSDTGSVTATVQISGNSCIPFTIPSFESSCSPNQLAMDFINLSNVMTLNSLDSSINYNMSNDTLIAPAVTSFLINTVGGSDSTMIWNFVTPDKVEIFDTTDLTTKLIFKTISITPPSAAADIVAYANIRGNYNNLFKMDGLDTAGNVIALIEGSAIKITGTDTTFVSMGECGFPPNAQCNTIEHEVRRDLEGLIKEILETNPFTGNVNLFDQPAFTPLLQSYFGTDTMTTSVYHYVDSIAFVYDTVMVPGYDSLTINGSGCSISLYHSLVHLDGQVGFGGMTISNLTALPPFDAQQNFHNFYVLASFRSHNRDFVDTVWGTSCLPLKNCELCTTELSVSIAEECSPDDISYWANAYDSLRAAIIAYNASPYATEHHDTIDVPDNFGSFVLNNPETDCADLYTDMLNDYAAIPADDTLDAPPLPEYPCEVLTFLMAKCDSVYVDYLNAVYSYNQYADSSGAIPIPVIYNNECFATYFCKCSDHFIAGLTAIENGYPLVEDRIGVSAFSSHSQLHLELACTPLTLACDTLPDTAFVFPLIPYSPNPCVVQAIAAATQNALNQYNQYVDSVSTSFITQYNEHCLHPVENLVYTYTDKEYHFTLYYYDQAGNLVKTIPPEGVEFLDIDSNTSPLELQVQQDRANNTHTVYTSHRMATTYEYNTLNQLIRQDMPDHDKMDVCESIQPNGLDNNLTVTGVQFIDANKGYLTGYLKRTIASTDLQRGYLYTTGNGGQNWTKVEGLAAGDIQKVQMVTATVGYAVSNYGLVFKTLDAGTSWDLLTTLYSTSSPYFGNLNDLYFSDALTGVVAGIQESGTGGAYTTSDGGATWSVASGFATHDTITGLTYDGTNYFASVKNGLKGKIYIGTSGGSSWMEQTAYSANDLEKIRYVNSDTAFAIGHDGTLLRSNSGNSTWTLMATNMPYKFSDVYFKNGWQGVALAEVIPGKYGIYKSLDGGTTWTLLSASGRYYSSLQSYDPAHGKVIAVGEDRAISKVWMSQSPFSITDINFHMANALTPDDYSYGTAVVASGNAASLVVSNNTPKAYFKYNIDNGDNWKDFTVTATGLSKFTKALISLTSGASPKTRGIMLGDDGVLYKFYRRYNSATPVLTAISVPGTNFTDITASNTANSGTFYAYDNTSATVYSIVYGTDSTVVATAMTNAAPITASINSLNISNDETELLLAGNNGALLHSSSFTSSSASWTEYTDNVVPLPLNDIAVSGTNLSAVGNDGTEWYSSDAGSHWKLAANETAAKLNAIQLNGASPAQGLIAADGGKLYQVNDGISAAPGLALIGTTTTSNLNDVALQNSGTAAFACTQSGKVVSVDDYTAPTPVTMLSSLGNANGALNGLSFISTGSAAMAVGDKSSVMMFAGVSGMNSQVYTQPVKAHFYDNHNGYAVDNGAVLRHTTNGGASWNVILPDASLPVISKVYATAATKAVVIGESNYVGNIINEATPATITVTGITSDFRDISFNANGYGVIVGTNAWTAKITASGSTYTVTSTGHGQAGLGGFDFNAVHVFNDVNSTGYNHFIAAGTNGKVYYHNPGITGGGFITQETNITSGATLNDIYFHDDRTGYVVGNNGEAYKCVLSSNIDVAGVSSSAAVQWQPLCPDAVYLGQTDTSVYFNSIAFATRTSGVLGGKYNSGGSSHLHALLLNDESMLYSTRFWYDKLGRMVISQNTKQFAKSPKAYSYTLYDALGRIKEVGEKEENTTVTKQPTVFGTTVNGFYNTKVIDDTKFLSWINGATGARKEVTRTYYDNTAITGLPVTQENLRKRVASVTYEDVYDGVDSTYAHATHYSYDIHGNVKTLIQENRKLYDEAVALSSAVVDQRFKRVDYEYDLISGKVNAVRYQDGQPDAFYHFYDYDADNRITVAYTSQYPQALAPITINTVTDNPLWDKEAKYFYYAHGPLARVEYGNEKVQGMDYAYTLQGWIKGVNSNALDEGRDMGQDGKTGGVYDPGNADIHKSVAKDAYGYTLNYFKGDYQAINGLRWNTTTDRFEAVTVGSQMMAATYDLYNGNIKSMVTTIPMTDTTGGGLANAQRPRPLGNAYDYDQLNRIKNSVSFNNINLSGNSWASYGSTGNLYKNAFAYDANGNILSQQRYNETGVPFDFLEYQYKKDAGGNMIQNRLYHVNDGVSASAPTDDIEDEGTFDDAEASINLDNNYSYDKIGNLAKDSAEEIQNIDWTVYGKIKSITRYTGSTKDNLTFDYDASGNRIAKHVLDSDNNWKYSTYYVRDAQGNVMSVYDHKVVSSVISYKLIEQDIFGSSRIGLNLPEREMIGYTSPGVLSHTLGKKQFETVNHLGNVLATLSDRKIAVDANTDGTIDYYQADVLTANDYYPFGAPMPGRLCYNDTTVLWGMDFDYEFFSDTLPFSSTGGAVLSVDYDNLLLISSTGSGTVPPYGAQVSQSLVAGRTYTLWGDARLTMCTSDFVILRIKDGTGSVIDSAVIYDGSGGVYITFTAPSSGTYYFQIYKTDGNACDFDISALYLSHAPVYTTICSDNGNYRYGFNGKEKDDEVKGSGNSYDYGDRMFDPRLGKMLSPDPIGCVFPWQSPYAYALNSPITFLDDQGAGPKKGIIKSGPPLLKNLIMGARTSVHFLTALLTSTPIGPNDVIEFGLGWHPNKNFTGTYKIVPGQSVFWYNDFKEYDHIQIFIPNTSPPPAEVLLWETGTDDGREPDGTGFYKATQRDKNFAKNSEDISNRVLPKGWGSYTIPAGTPENITIKVNAKNPEFRNPATDGKASVWGFYIRNPAKVDPPKDTPSDPPSTNKPTPKSRPKFDCFISGTQIAMEDGSVRPIEKLKIGDKVLSFNLQTMKTEADEIVSIASPIHDSIVTLKFSDGTINANTEDHPYYVKGKGWCSLKPEQTKLKYGLLVHKLEIGDICLKLNSSEITEIKFLSFVESVGEKQTYNISALKKHNSYFANGILVSNEKK